MWLMNSQLNIVRHSIHSGVVEMAVASIVFQLAVHRVHSQSCGPMFGQCSRDECCSPDGICGFSTAAHCGIGCQAEYGRCFKRSSQRFPSSIGHCPWPGESETILKPLNDKKLAAGGDFVWHSSTDGTILPKLCRRGTWLSCQPTGYQPINVLLIRKTVVLVKIKQPPNVMYDGDLSTCAAPEENTEKVIVTVPLDDPRPVEFVRITLGRGDPSTSGGRNSFHVVQVDSRKDDDSIDVCFNGPVNYRYDQSAVFTCPGGRVASSKRSADSPRRYVNVTINGRVAVCEIDIAVKSASYTVAIVIGGAALLILIISVVVGVLCCRRRPLRRRSPLETAPTVRFTKSVSERPSSASEPIYNSIYDCNYEVIIHHDRAQPNRTHGSSWGAYEQPIDCSDTDQATAHRSRRDHAAGHQPIYSNAAVEEGVYDELDCDRCDENSTRNYYSTDEHRQME